MWSTTVKDDVALLGLLGDCGTGIDPIVVIRCKDIFETLESAVDASETVANALERITLNRASNGRH